MSTDMEGLAAMVYLGILGNLLVMAVFIGLILGNLLVILSDTLRLNDELGDDNEE